MTAKTCIFCGNPPTDKNKEHVLPAWLIKLTGDPGRVVPLGLEKRITGFTQREFVYSAFHFPACEGCNEEFAGLEARIKATVERLLSTGQIAAAAVPNLLDWLDKVRVGLWLGHRALDKNVYGIQPRFHIKQRMGYHDRMVALYGIDTKDPSLTFSCTDLPVFAFTPSCFALRINSICFINMSFDFLLAKRLGLPFPSQSRLRPDDKMEYRMAQGTGRISRTPIEPKLPFHPLEFYQPNRPPGQPQLDELYATAHAATLGLSPPSCRGAVLTIEAGQPRVIDPEATYELRALVPRSAFGGPIVRAVLEWQLTLHSRVVSLALLPRAVQRRLREERQQAARVHGRVLRAWGAA